MQRAIQNTQAATRRRSCPLRVAGNTLTANVAFAVLKYAALTAAGVLLFRWGQGYALAERGYEAIGGEALLLGLPLFWYLTETTIRDTVRDIPEGISFEDTDATEKIIEQGNLSIVYSGKTLKPLQTRRGLVFIESRYLLPVSDVLDVLELYERVTPFGAPYIVAKAGFLLQAVIMPCDVISAQFVQRLQELTRQCAVSLDLREQERERQAAVESAGQFKVDPETGAIIEPESEAGDDD